MSGVTRPKSINSLFDFFDEADIPKKDVATAQQMQDLREFSTGHRIPYEDTNSEVDMQDGENLDDGVEQTISESSIEDTYVIINVESYECVDISMSNTYLRSVSPNSVQSFASTNDTSEYSEDASSQDDSSDNASDKECTNGIMCEEVYDARADEALEYNEVVEHFKVLSEISVTSPCMSEAECVDAHRESETGNNNDTGNAIGDGPRPNSEDGESEDERDEMDSNRDLLDSAEDSATDDEDIISHNSDSPIEGRPYPSSNLSTRYHRYRTNVYGTDGEDLSTVIITKSYIENNKADAMAEGAKTYGELMSALKRKRAAELRRTENNDTVIIKVVKHRDTLNERIKGKGKIAKSTSAFNIVGTPTQVKIDVESPVNPSVSNSSAEEVSTNTVMKARSQSSVEIWNAETNSDSKNNNITSLEEDSTSSNVLATQFDHPTKSTSLDEAGNMPPDMFTSKKNVNESETRSISVGKTVNYANGIQASICKEENTDTFCLANMKLKRPTIVKKQTYIHPSANNNTASLSFPPQQRGTMNMKSGQQMAAGNGVDLKKGPKPVLPAIGQKKTQNRMVATEITRKIQPIPNLQQKISIGSIAQPAKTVMNDVARCRKDCASNRVPLQLKSDACYRNGQLELSILGIERIYSREPLNVKLTLLNKHNRSDICGKNPYKKSSARKQKKLQKLVNRPLDTTNINIIQQRAMWPPFNTYTDPEASRRHEQFFGGGI